MTTKIRNKEMRQASRIFSVPKCLERPLGLIALIPALLSFGVLIPKAEATLDSASQNTSTFLTEWNDSYGPYYQSRAWNSQAGALSHEALDPDRLFLRKESDTAMADTEASKAIGSYEELVRSYVGSVNAQNAMPNTYQKDATAITEGSLEALKPNTSSSGNSSIEDTNEALPYCDEATGPRETTYTCQAPLASKSCTIGRRLFASALTPINAEGNIDYSDFWEAETNNNWATSSNNGIISPRGGSFRVGNDNTQKGNCRVFTQSRSFIVDSPEAIKAFIVKQAVYKDYVRLSFTVSNVPMAYYEGLLGVSPGGKNASLSMGSLSTPAFTNTKIVFNKPNSYLPPIVPLPKQEGHTVCYGGGKRTENLNLDIWDGVLRALPSGFKGKPFMLTLKVEVSVVVRGYAYMDFDYVYDPSLILKVNDLTTSSIECLDKVVALGMGGSNTSHNTSHNTSPNSTQYPIEISCESSYVSDKAKNLIGAGPQEFRKPTPSFLEYKGNSMYLSTLKLPAEITSAINEDRALLDEFNKSLDCRLWRIGYFDEQETQGNSKAITRLDESSLDLASIPYCGVGAGASAGDGASADARADARAEASASDNTYFSDKLLGYSCREVTRKVVGGSLPRLVKTYVCTRLCREGKPIRINASEYLTVGGCHIETRTLTKPELHERYENIPCEEFYDEAKGYSSNCTSLRNDNNCVELESYCLDDDEARLSTDKDGTVLMSECSMKSVVYRCRRELALGAGDLSQEVKCGENPLRCTGEACLENTLPSMNAKARSDKAKALGSIGILEYMQDDTVCKNGVCRIFSGEEHTCRCGYKGSFDCCAQKTKVSAYDYVRLSSYIMTLEAASKLVGSELADFGSWSDIQATGNGLISSELDSLIGEYSKNSLESVRSSFLKELSQKTADLVEALFGKDLRDRLFAQGATEGATTSVTLNPEVLNCAQGLMQAYMAYKMAATAYEIITACHENEYETSMRLNLKSCVYQGSECDHKLLGKCLVRKRHYCCYNSPLARIVMNGLKEQGYQGQGCQGITAEELSNYDLGLIDFAEWNELVAESGVLPKVQSTIDEITGSGSVLSTGTRQDAKVRSTERLNSMRMEE